MPGFLPWMPFRLPPLLAQWVDLDVRLYYAAVQNLIQGCGYILQTTVENSDTPPIEYAKHVQQSVDISSQLPAGLQCDPIQMAELRQQVQDAWDNLSQDDIRHLYVRLHACVAARGAKLCTDVTVWAPLTVTCFIWSEFVIIRL